MLSFFYTLTVLELFMGGGGRLLEIGPITVRMVLFAFCVIIGLAALFYPGKRINGMRLALSLVIVYLLVHLSSIAIGMANGAVFKDIMKEFQQSLYWLAAPFFAAVLSSERQIRRTVTLVRISGMLLAVAYLIVLLIGLVTRSVKILELFAYLFDQGELLQRGGGLLFYKGFLYLSISLVFFVAMRGRGWIIAAMIVLAALVLTLTRGLIISTAAAVLLLLVIQRRMIAVVLALGVAAAAAFAVWVYLPSANDTLASGREMSNQLRLDDMDYVIHYATLKTVFLGEGYGTLINDRIAVENTFLWAFWKLGMLGVAFWMTPLVLCARYFLAIPNAWRNSIACSFLCGTVLIYTQTMTNPFLNNPIGLSFVMMSIFALRTLAAGSPGAPASAQQVPRRTVSTRRPGVYPEDILQPALE